jgi:hypothetical protein
MPECWYVVEEASLRELLVAASNGEDPDALLIEFYANCDSEKSDP